MLQGRSHNRQPGGRCLVDAGQVGNLLDHEFRFAIACQTQACRGCKHVENVSLKKTTLNTFVHHIDGPHFYLHP